MTAVAVIVTRALRLIGVADAGEAPAAMDMQTGIDALNALCTRVEADGIALGWADVAQPSDPMPTRPEADEPLAYMLAVRLADEFRVPASASVVATAQIGLGKLHADTLRNDGARLDYDLPTPASANRSLAAFLGGA